MNKDEVEKLGIEVIEIDKSLTNEKTALIEQVKQLLPNIVNSDNVINDKALSDLFDITNTTANNQGYELTFAGKGIAKHKADTETDMELEYIASQSKDTGENENTENIIIRGDNLDVLKILKQNYTDKIKMIYIDPPYNTESENFIYNDNFKQSEQQLIEELGLNEQTTDFLENMYGTQTHSGWLAFMYPRLKLAKDLLTEDGVIFISIDDNEQANLKIICDEIFGANNFIGSLKWKRKKQPSFLSSHIASVMEYIYIYGKNKVDLEKLSIEGISDSTKKVINLSNHYSSRKFTKGVRVKIGDKGVIKKGKYKIKSMDVEYKDDVRYENGITTNDVEVISKFSVRQDLINKFIEEDLLFITKNKGLRRDVSEEEIGKRKSIVDLIVDWGDNQDNDKEQINLLGTKVFEYAKPTLLIKNIIKSLFSDNEVILDFFAGSGTTADAVMQLNDIDNGNRKFMMVQWDEKIDNKDSKTAYDFCTDNNFAPVISSITIERINRAGDKIKVENPISNIDIGYKVFKCKEKQKLSQNTQGELYLENQRNSIIDSIYNLLVATGKQLHLPIETTEQDKAYIIDNCLYIVGNVSKTIFELHSDKQIYIDGTIDFPLQDYLNLGIQNKENIKVIF